MISLMNTDEDEFFRIWFNNRDKEEYFETIRLNLGDSVEVISDKDKIYDMINRVTNKSIKNYTFKNIKSNRTAPERPFSEKIGLLLMNFLNTDFSDFDRAFDNFYSIYGCDFLYNYSIYEICPDYFDTEKDAYDSIKVLHERGYRELTKLQENYKKAVEFIFNLNNNDKYSKYSIKSKFSACLVSNKFYLRDYSSQMKIMPKVNNYNYDDKYKLDFDTLLSEIDYNSFMINVIDIYLINNIEVLLFIILHQLVSNDFIIKKCQICNKYFVPSKANELYCEFTNEENNTICREIGAFQVYKKNLESVPALLEYRRTYNKKGNEVSRNKENLNLKKSFDKWKKDAQSKIKDYKQGKLTEDELYKWMMENK